MKCADQINDIRESILRGRVEPGAMVGTEFEFAQKWQLSRNTVRRGIEQLVNEGLLERRPGKGLYARAPHTSTRTVQVVVPDMTWSYMGQIARGVKAEGQGRGAQVQVYDAHGEMDWDMEFIRQLPNGTADGAIIASLHHRRFSEVLFELKTRAYPFVLVDQGLHDLEVPTVEICNYDGGFCVGQKLAQLGHQRIAFLGPMRLDAVVERLNGFRDAMLDEKVLFDRSLVIDMGGEGLTEWLNNRLEVAEEAIIRLLESPNPPTAIFDGSGDLAPIMYRAVQKLGLRIPNDVSVVTFDDAATFSQFLDPPVAQLKHSWNEVGRAALDILMTEINRTTQKSRNEPKEHRKVGFVWVEGASLARVPQESGQQ
jgi:DNA-binding LacI/PurR family transcriptional regulator